MVLSFQRWLNENKPLGGARDGKNLLIVNNPGQEMKDTSCGAIWIPCVNCVTEEKCM